jgi:lipoprotein-anchoring transpeptidase ErfK/SrfK
MYDLSSLACHARQQARAVLSVLLLVGCLLFSGACRDLPGAHPSKRAARYGAVSVVGVSPLQQIQGLLQLETLQHWIALMQRYQGPIGVYQQKLAGARRALQTARSAHAYQVVLQTLAGQVREIRVPALKAESASLNHQLTRQVTAWSQTHTYHDRYNNTTYELGYEYGSEGIGGLLHDELAGAKAPGDYQQAIEDANMVLQNFQAYRANVGDRTPWNQVHQADLQLLRHYGLFGQRVVVISLGEQALRVYRHGRLIKAFQVTTGRPQRPSLPGAWSVESKQAPTVFKSDEPPGSQYWYPDTPINYAMLYHSGGYFLHDSWWRDDYGFGTQFPHVDSGGDSFSFDGSHGCVNISTPNAAWLYNFVDVSTRIVLY